MDSQVEQTAPVRLAGAVSEEAIRHLMIRSDLNRAIYAAVRGYSMSNMCDADDGACAYPLVDLMSNPAPADISSGEMEMVSLTDEIEAAVRSLALPKVESETIERRLAEALALVGDMLPFMEPARLREEADALERKIDRMPVRSLVRRINATLNTGGTHE